MRIPSPPAGPSILRGVRALRAAISRIAFLNLVPHQGFVLRLCHWLCQRSAGPVTDTAALAVPVAPQFLALTRH
jgi:hypothetical protein